MFDTQKFKQHFSRTVLLTTLIAFQPLVIQAGGGLVIEDDICLLRIDFYTAHFTAYQPNSSGNAQFCQDLPDIGETIFVLDYLHQSLKEVPVDFRIIRDITGQGRYVKLKHINEIDDLEQHTLFYQPPVIRMDASLKVEYEFLESGSYLGIITAGHPSKDTVYTAVFPFEVGGFDYAYLLPLLLLALFGIYFLSRFIRTRYTPTRRKEVL